MSQIGWLAKPLVQKSRFPRWEEMDKNLGMMTCFHGRTSTEIHTLGEVVSHWLVWTPTKFLRQMSTIPMIEVFSYGECYTCRIKLGMMYSREKERVGLYK